MFVGGFCKGNVWPINSQRLIYLNALKEFRSDIYRYLYRLHPELEVNIEGVLDVLATTWL